jgi:transposase
MMKAMAKYEIRLRDDQWQKLEPILIGRQGDPGANARDNRLFIDALLWVVVNQASWSSLPAQFGKFSTAYMRFRRWNECDFWRYLAHSMADDVELRQLLETIVGYGDRYTSRLELRSKRKAKKHTYRLAFSAAGAVQPDMLRPLLSDESTSHWVSLVRP